MDKTVVYILLVSCAALVESHQATLCDVKSCKPGTHTLCIFPSPRPAPACGEGGIMSLTQEEKDALLRVHNDYRAYVASGQEKRGRNGRQPAATNLGPMEWNDEIAAIAQRWVNQCYHGHDQCRNTATMTVGQNIMSLSNRDGWDDIKVDYWYNEVTKFNNDTVSSYEFSPDSCHYTQLVWAETTMLGCGVAKYRNRDWYQVHLVCNYAPSGNWIGQPIYKTP